MGKYDLSSGSIWDAYSCTLVMWSFNQFSGMHFWKTKASPLSSILVSTVFLVDLVVIACLTRVTSWGEPIPFDSWLITLLEEKQVISWGELINLDFWLIFDPNLPFFFSTISWLILQEEGEYAFISSSCAYKWYFSIFRYLAQKWESFTNFAKRGALGVEFQQKWRFNEAPGTKRIRTWSCYRHTIGCRVRTTVLWSQKLCTTGHLDRAQSLGRTGAVRIGTTVHPQLFSRLNQFCEGGRLVFFSFIFRK